MKLPSPRLWASWKPYVDALDPKTAARRFAEHGAAVDDLLDRGEAYYRGLVE